MRGHQQSKKHPGRCLDEWYFVGMFSETATIAQVFLLRSRTFQQNTKSNRYPASSAAPTVEGAEFRRKGWRPRVIRIYSILVLSSTRGAAWCADAPPSPSSPGCWSTPSATCSLAANYHQVWCKFQVSYFGFKRQVTDNKNRTRLFADNDGLQSDKVDGL